MDPTDTQRCAVVSLDLDEALAGTAVHAEGLVVVEHDGPWTPRAPSSHELGHAATTLATDPRVRVQLARPVRTGHDPDAVARRHLPGSDQPRSVLLAHPDPDPARRWLRRLVVPDLAALAALDPTVTLDPTPPDHGDAVEGDVWLVCTHGRRDACCASLGRPAALALALAGHEVHETTHTGGHRFAGTAIVLPTGLVVGRLDTAAARRLADEHAAGRIDTVHLRGRCSLPPAGQAAEAALRAELGLEGIDDVRVVDVEASTDPAVPDPAVPDPAAPDAVHDRQAADDMESVTAVLLDAPGGRWRATVVAAAAALPRAVSDGADATRPTTQTVRSLERVGR